MAEIIYHIATTVDNLIADLNNDCPPRYFLSEGDHIPDFLDQIREYDAVLMGGKTYEFGFKFGLKPGDPGYKGLKHIIFSNTLEFESNDEVELVRENAIEYVKAARNNPGKKYWVCGGGRLAASLLENELIDTLVLKLNPTIGGEGLRLFGNSVKNVQLELKGVKRYASGVLLLTYRIMYWSIFV